MASLLYLTSCSDKQKEAELKSKIVDLLTLLDNVKGASWYVCKYIEKEADWDLI